MSERKPIAAGTRFARLVVIARAENSEQGSTQHLCRCDCGKETVVRGYNLRNGKTRSCGCLASDVHRTVLKRVKRVGTGSSAWIDDDEEWNS
jgi:hypothetical protein